MDNMVSTERRSSVNGGGKPGFLNRRASVTPRGLTTAKFSAALDEAAADLNLDGEESSTEVLRLQIKKYITHSHFGRFYENILILLSVVSSVEYIYETYLNDSSSIDRAQLKVLKDMEVVFACIFGMDWVLTIFLADHRINAMFSLYSIIDLMTVIPIFVTYGYSVPNVNYIYNIHDAGIYIAYALNTARILRALRIRKKLARVRDAVERFLGEIVLAIMVMILFFASVMQFLERTYQPHDFHTWMYYIWVTISTVGYGDISPKSTQGRVAVMCIIGFSIISIPKMTNELIEKMALQSVYMRNVYTKKGKHSKHIVICGDLTSTSLDEFFEELFHEDHENVDLNAVLLLPTPPTTEIIFLLRDSSYSLNLQYLEGSALIDKDLRRAQAQHAMAIFIMTNKFSEKPDEEDAKSILLNLSIKRYVASYNLPPKLFCLQLIRPHNRRHLAREAGGEMSENDLVVCLNEIKMGVLAKAVMYPGVNTLLMNLISSFAEEAEVGAEEGEDEHDRASVAGAPVAISETANDLADLATDKAWLEEYQKGCDWEIYTTPLAKFFEGAKFCELAYALYDKMGVVLFALEITDTNVKSVSKLLLNPANFIIPSQDLFTIEAFVIAQNKASSDLSFKQNTTKTGDDASFSRHDAEAGFSTLPRVDSNPATLGATAEPSRSSTGGNETAAQAAVIDFGTVGQESMQPAVKKAVVRSWKSLKRVNMVEREMESFSYQEILHQLEDQHMKKEYYLRSAPVDLASCVVKTNVIDEVPFINNHVIIIGKEMNNLVDLIKPLRAKFLGMLHFIVIITPDDIPQDVWARISMFDAILIVRGSPLEEVNLRRAGIFRCAQVVVLADGLSDSKESGMEALVDSDAIFAYQLVKRMNPTAQMVVEVVNTCNISYFQTAENASSPADYKFTPQFAAGNLFTTSLLDSIVCQTYYNPSIIKVMNKLIAGVDYVEAAELAAEATAKVAQQAMTAKRSTGAAQSDSSSDSDEEEGGGNGAALNATQELPGSPSGNVGMSSAKVASTKKIQDIQGSCLYQMAIPDSFTGKTYGKLFQHLSAQGMVPLGLLRGTFAGLSVGPKANRAPYVYTNPDKDVEIFKCDKVFVLSTKPIQANTKPTFKDCMHSLQQHQTHSPALASLPVEGSRVQPSASELIAGSAASASPNSLDLKTVDARVSQLSHEMHFKLDGILTALGAWGALEPSGAGTVVPSQYTGNPAWVSGKQGTAAAVTPLSNMQDAGAGAKQGLESADEGPRSVKFDELSAPFDDISRKKPAPASVKAAWTLSPESMVVVDGAVAHSLTPLEAPSAFPTSSHN